MLFNASICASSLSLLVFNTFNSASCTLFIDSHMHLISLRIITFCMKTAEHAPIIALIPIANLSTSLLSLYFPCDRFNDAYCYAVACLFI